MAIERLDHVSILTRDGEGVVAFYRDVLGFVVVRRRDVPALEMLVWDLEARGDAVEVIQPTGDTVKAHDGLKHVAFRSDDVEGDFRAFVARGVKLLHPAVQRHGAARFFFVQGPAGELLEVIQYDGPPPVGDGRAGHGH